MRAASTSVINPKQIILGSYSEPKKVTLSDKLSKKSNLTQFCLSDQPAAELRKNPTAVATAIVQRLQPGRHDRHTDLLLRAAVHRADHPSVEVSKQTKSIFIANLTVCSRHYGIPA